MQSNGLGNANDIPPNIHSMPFSCKKDHIRRRVQFIMVTAARRYIASVPLDRLSQHRSHLSPAVLVDVQYKCR